MEKNGKKKIQKYTTLYMSTGMCLGVSGGLLYGRMLFPDNMLLGMSFGIPIGTCIGMAIGAAKDKRLAENMMEISRMEEVKGSPDMLIYAVDKNGAEKEYRVNEKRMKEEKFLVGDRVAEEAEGVLVSLESK
ncbi:MAG: hypothetical protein ACI4E5_08450 [Suilimivivens sp.]